MKHIYKMDLLYTIVLLATLIGSQIRQVEAQTQCAEQRFCSECITAHNECAWCNDVEFTDTRCAMNTSILTSKGCQEIKSPTNNETKTQDKPVQDGGENVEPVQLQPQKVKLTRF
ncbi:integrin beta-7-like [Mya arenaria]|uniref:integrin beta-7-like n=1 Tax=Mya arenaria TaxID=6604 RepID=UPI0022DF136B|nr:integrin beta-7-like [Mya arenaria]